MFNEKGAKMRHSIEKYVPALCQHLKTDNLFQVHRLDKNTTGIVLLAKTKDMHAKLVRLFRERKIEKSYWAILNGTPEPQEGKQGKKVRY